MNDCKFTGRMTKDSEITRTQSGTVIARNSLAIDRGKDKDGNDRGADFINLVAFGKTAEFFEKYVTKGRKYVIAKSRVQTGSYEKDGHKVYTTDFVVENIEFADSNNSAPAKTNANDFMDIPDSDIDELPFN